MTAEGTDETRLTLRAARRLMADAWPRAVPLPAGPQKPCDGFRDQRTMTLCRHDTYVSASLGGSSWDRWIASSTACCTSFFVAQSSRSSETPC